MKCRRSLYPMRLDASRRNGWRINDSDEKGQLPKEVYTGSRDAQAIVERRLQTAAERCINGGNHVIARLGLRSPSEYADVFRVLGESKIIPWQIAEQMMDMARLRNLLVHVYWAIDHGRVYDSLQTRLRTLEAFAHHIAQWLKAREERGTPRALDAAAGSC